MITAEELRLGNLLMTIKNDHIVTVGIDEIIYLFEDKTTHKLMGIPITVEWLEKLGFKKISGFKDMAWYECGGLTYEIKHKRLFLSENEDNEDDFVVCEHIHTLQNLYHALTGKELKEEDNFIEI